MRKELMVFLTVSLILLLGVSLAEAGLINYERRSRMLKGGGGAAPAAGQEENLPQWMKTMPPVNNRTERRYDVNRDGYLQTAEVKIFLRDVVDQVEQRGGVEVISDILKEYDKNRDGIINRYEVTDIKKDAAN